MSTKITRKLVIKSRSHDSKKPINKITIYQSSLFNLRTKASHFLFQIHPIHIRKQRNAQIPIPALKIYRTSRHPRPLGTRTRRSLGEISRKRSKIPLSNIRPGTSPHISIHYSRTTIGNQQKAHPNTNIRLISPSLCFEYLAELSQNKRKRKQKNSSCDLVVANTSQMSRQRGLPENRQPLHLVT